MRSRAKGMWWGTAIEAPDPAVVLTANLRGGGGPGLQGAAVTASFIVS